MPQPKKTARNPDADQVAPEPPPTVDAHEDALHAAVNALRELLTRGVVITGDRLQETVDEAVREGRMTRRDSEDLVQNLLQISRRQTQDALADLEALFDRSTSEARRLTNDGVKGVAAAARRAPGADRALRTVDRARRAAGLGPTFPIMRYDELTAAQVMDRLGKLSPAELRKVRDHERRNANRKSVLGAIEKQLA
jgi:polyhydroxyalkanoate synthesis regulator phasin